MTAEQVLVGPEVSCWFCGVTGKHRLCMGIVQRDGPDGTKARVPCACRRCKPANLGGPTRSDFEDFGGSRSRGATGIKEVSDGQ